MKKITNLFCVSNLGLLHTIVASFFLLITMFTNDAMCFVIATVGYFYGLFNYCKSINLKNIKE